MYIVTLALFFMICSSSYGFGADYGDEGVGDDEENVALNDENDRDGVEDSDGGLDKTIQDIKSNIGIQESGDSGIDDFTEANKLNSMNNRLKDNYKTHGVVDGDDHTEFIDKTKLNLGDDEVDVKQYQLELAAGDLAEFLGNSHHNELSYYKDLSRRFVPVYPSEKRKAKKHLTPKLDGIIGYLLSPKKSLRENEDRDIVPIRAPPEIVLAAMKNGTKKYASKPSDHTEEVIRNYMLRSGDYWDNVWKEEVDPTVLRTEKVKKHKSLSLPITAKLVPGTKLYNLLEKLVKKSPKLLYIISN